LLDASIDEYVNTNIDWKDPVQTIVQMHPEFVHQIRWDILLKIFLRRPNLKNWSHLSNLRRGSNMVGSTRNSVMCFEIWAGAQLEPVLGGSATRFKFFKFGLGFSVTKMKALSRGKCNFFQVYKLKLMLMYSIDTLNQVLSVTV